ncbi:DegV family protein [Macrococcus sp. DPC7161]|uniref:DegV family protein n=1 Tax=Macrococcus sp. DPC7161 TaxID=2507060 RepID=UPI00100AC48B|nr:DegV family protein [Macrococcus sp. DPC7161]RXK19234.1 DegV family protein [Macrococcus sp. DPC7161]
MNKIKLVVDSTHDLNPAFIQEHEIIQVPLNIIIDGKTYLDQEEISSSEYLDQLKVLNDIPKTSQPPTGKFVEIYEKYINEGYDILSIHMTHRLSGTVNSAETASKMVEGNVQVVDSGFISQAYGMIIQEVAEAIDAGKSMDELLTLIDHLKKRTKLFLVISQLDHLTKGGRISRGKGFLGGLMNLKPVAEVIDGEIHVLQNARTYNAVVKLLKKEVASMHSHYKQLKIGISVADADELKEKLQAQLAEFTQHEITINVTTPIVSTHTGPGAIGLSILGYDA